MVIKVSVENKDVEAVYISVFDHRLKLTTFFEEVNNATTEAVDPTEADYGRRSIQTVLEVFCGVNRQP